MNDKVTTESDSIHDRLETKSTKELLIGINGEDQSVAHSVATCLPSIERIVEAVVEKLKNGGRLFYLGSGTSGRLGIVDASECPPTFGVPHGVVVGIIAGGDMAIRKAVEHAEDDTKQGWKDLVQHNVSSDDIVIGISASGKTPYVLGAIEACKENNILTGGISCNFDSPLGRKCDFPIDCPVGPEFVTGSTRMKSGTAQKLILNMITTATMIRLGKVKGNKMVDMQLSNNKLIERGTRMIHSETNLPPGKCKELLLQHGSVRAALNSLKSS